MILYVSDFTFIGRASKYAHIYWTVYINGFACAVAHDITAFVQIYSGTYIYPIVLQGVCEIVMTGDVSIHVYIHRNPSVPVDIYTGYGATTHVAINEVYN